MSSIRGNHSSPGTYVKFTGVKYKRSGNEQVKPKVGGGTMQPTSGGDIQPDPKYWVIGMRLPGTLSPTLIEDE